MSRQDAQDARIEQIVGDDDAATFEDCVDRFYEQGAVDGWWPCPYGCTGGGNVGLSQETILRNTLGLKNVVGMLLEARSSGGPTRPNELGNFQENRRRKGYSQLWTQHQLLDHFRANRAEGDGMTAASSRLASGRP
jgi:hypothetical protein